MFFNEQLKQEEFDYFSLNAQTYHREDLADDKHLVGTAQDNCQVERSHDSQLLVEMAQDNHCQVEMAHKIHRPKERAHENHLVEITHDTLQEDLVHENSPVDKPHGNCHVDMVHDNCQERDENCKGVAYMVDLGAAVVVVGSWV